MEFLDNLKGPENIPFTKKLANMTKSYITLTYKLVSSLKSSYLKDNFND
jgi:hypothetical protein